MANANDISSKALRFAYDRYVGKDPERADAFEAALAHADVARKIADLRTQANLTQGELAKLAGTSTSVIRRLEDADDDDEGHSLAMLRRIAAAVGKQVEIRFVSVTGTTSPAS